MPNADDNKSERWRRIAKPILKSLSPSRLDIKMDKFHRQLSRTVAGEAVASTDSAATTGLGESQARREGVIKAPFVTSRTLG